MAVAESVGFETHDEVYPRSRCDPTTNTQPLAVVYYSTRPQAPHLPSPYIFAPPLPPLRCDEPCHFAANRQESCALRGEGPFLMQVA